jgi:hypothetical protein
MIRKFNWPISDCWSEIEPWSISWDRSRFTTWGWTEHELWSSNWSRSKGWGS